jgi:hypothetical protein
LRLDDESTQRFKEYAAKDQNGDHTVDGEWSVRLGLASTGLGLVDTAINAMTSTKGPAGVKLMYATAGGSIEAVDTPDAEWS